MTDVFKDFDIVLAERRAASEEKERPAFRLCGETFTCKRKMGANAAIDLGKLVTEGTSEDIKDFILAVLRPADAKRFEALLEADEDGELDMELLGDIVAGILEAYTGRPTETS